MMHTQQDMQAARHAAILEEINREREARRARRGQPSWCRGAADAVSIIALAYIIGLGLWLCWQYLLTLYI